MCNTPRISCNGCTIWKKGVNLMTVYVNPGEEGSIVDFKKRYDHFIGGEWVAPAEGQYL